jgi:hypothetical protein
MPRDLENCSMPSIRMWFLQAFSVEPQATRLGPQYPCLKWLRVPVSEQLLPSKDSEVRG